MGQTGFAEIWVGVVLEDRPTWGSSDGTSSPRGENRKLQRERLQGMLKSIVEEESPPADDESARPAGPDKLLSGAPEGTNKRSVRQYNLSARLIHNQAIMDLFEKVFG